MSKKISSYSLTIFASFQQLFLTLIENNQFLVQKTIKVSNNFVTVFFSSLEKLLTDYDLNLETIQNIYAGVGPGSYLINRAIVTFLKTSKILNPSLVVFTINNLVFQILPKEKTISLVDANKKNFYVMVSSDQANKSTFYSLTKTSLAHFLDDYPKYQIHQNFSGFDHWKHFMLLKRKFILVKDWKKIKTIEL